MTRSRSTATTFRRVVLWDSKYLRPARRIFIINEMIWSGSRCSRSIQHSPRFISWCGILNTAPRRKQNSRKYSNSSKMVVVEGFEPTQPEDVGFTDRCNSPTLPHYHVPERTHDSDVSNNPSRRRGASLRVRKWWTLRNLNPHINRARVLCYRYIKGP